MIVTVKRAVEDIQRAICNSQSQSAGTNHRSQENEEGNQRFERQNRPRNRISNRWLSNADDHVIVMMLMGDATNDDHQRIAFGLFFL